MRTRSHQRKVLDALPEAIRGLLSRRSHAAREAVEEYGVLCRESRRGVERRLHALGVSGAFPDPDATWEALGAGRKAALFGALEECDARDHAVSLALRLLDGMAGDQGDAC